MGLRGKVIEIAGVWKTSTVRRCARESVGMENTDEFARREGATRNVREGGNKEKVNDAADLLHIHTRQ